MVSKLIMQIFFSSKKSHLHFCQSYRRKILNEKFFDTNGFKTSHLWTLLFVTFQNIIGFSREKLTFLKENGTHVSITETPVRLMYSIQVCLLRLLEPRIINGHFWNSRIWWEQVLRLQPIQNKGALFSWFINWF